MKRKRTISDQSPLSNRKGKNSQYDVSKDLKYIPYAVASRPLIIDGPILPHNRGQRMQAPPSPASLKSRTSIESMALAEETNRAPLTDRNYAINTGYMGSSSDWDSQRFILDPYSVAESTVRDNKKKPKNEAIDIATEIDAMLNSDEMR